MDSKLNTKKAGIIFIIIASFISFLLSISSVNRAIAAPKADISNLNNKLDIRFLMDMSYSMKKNDPNNLRVRALQKIVKELPEGSKSGVWTYAKYVNMLVPISKVDSKWKKKAIFQLDKISGFGSNSNLLSAFEKATHGWQDKSNYQKNMVVITDGGLKPSDSEIVNTRAKLKLLTRLIPKLKKAGIKVSTVSIGDQSDERLLKIIASQTGGNWYYVKTPELLSKVTQHVFEQIASNNFNNQNKVVTLSKNQ